MNATELYNGVSKCRICGCGDLSPAISLGLQALTGRFPTRDELDPPMAPLELIRCHDCGLVQLRHSVDVTEMFDESYGYRSGMNATMRNHLAGITASIAKVTALADGDIVLDIGCNDGTLLQSYANKNLLRMGIDPIAEAFREEYPPQFRIHAGFFNADSFAKLSGGGKAKVVTSISMFYDLEDPGSFVGDVAKVLSPDGIWVLEQSYLPEMLLKNSFDTICHEHLEYYALMQIEALMAEKQLRVFDVKLNDINGGSFQVWVCRANAPYVENTSTMKALREREAAMSLMTDAPFAEFRENVADIGIRLSSFIKDKVAQGKRIYVYGASTKGNVLLQHFGLDHSLLVGCADRNPTKWGRRTPGTAIPIMSEEDARKDADYFLVLPWHFRTEFISREAEFLARGGHLIFPLPEFEVVGKTAG